MREVFNYIFGLVASYTNCDLLWFFSVPIGRQCLKVWLCLLSSTLSTSSQSTVVIMQIDAIQSRHRVNIIKRKMPTAASIIIFWCMVQCTLIEGFPWSVDTCLQNSIASCLTGLYNFTVLHCQNLQSQTIKNLKESIISHSWNKCLCVANQEDFLVAQMYENIFLGVFFKVHSFLLMQVFRRIMGMCWHREGCVFL